MTLRRACVVTVMGGSALAACAHTRNCCIRLSFHVGVDLSILDGSVANIACSAGVLSSRSLAECEAIALGTLSDSAFGSLRHT